MNFYSNCPQCQGERQLFNKPASGPSSAANDDPCPRGFQRNRFGQCVRGHIG